MIVFLFLSNFQSCFYGIMFVDIQGTDVATTD